jgi:ribonucleoside-triphosphate reductase
MNESNYFNTIYQSFIYKSRYSKYLQDDHRRETWPETIARYFDFFTEHLQEQHNYTLTSGLRAELETAVLNMEIMPSMRGLMTAGPALKRDAAAIYNCAYLPIDSFQSFDEELYTLMLGTGVGFSVEAEAVARMPVVAEEFHPTDTTIVVADSRIGWAKAYRELISLLSAGQIPKYDVSKLRPKGARLKTFGGRSSGPEPLVDLFEFTIATFKKAAGRKITTLEAHDLACKVADIVVVGGVRRSALISLSDLTDERMRSAKAGQWWNQYGHRRLANNSAIYEEKPEVGVFLQEWLSLYESKSGERGIFSRQAAISGIVRSNDFRRKHFGDDVRIREIAHKFGTNPCSEIILRPYEFCNLTEVVVRPTDDLASLKRKIRLATILGTFQSTLTKFRYLNKKWQRNCEDERLLGVSLTGIFDNTLTNGKDGQAELENALQELRMEAIATNMQYADKIGIPQSLAITCVKPSGTVSALVDSASGIHSRHSEYYFRYVRNDIKDPVTKFLQDAGIPWEVDAYDPNNMVAFKFPMKSPEQAIFRDELTAIDHLELWKTYQIHYCEHKPSVTITVKEHEWPSVGAWVYDNFEFISGVSFLPMDGGTYKQMPFTDCTKDEYEALAAKMPKTIDWSQLAVYELEDTTTSSQELACVAGGCVV